MEGNLVRYTLRVNPQLLKKLNYIAQFEGRSKNKELEQMIKHRIAAFEEQHGKIETEK